ncbi:hypothetical protein GLYMA_03G121400v4 [Glycine max]|uniref:IREH1/IRE-like N-terminal domain-containing protein n=2 Tax=Glycine subgen. Soja TaxID=1462606 RepID=K7KEK8_SOYBN|nr:probable serine/threonine protein kinase IREH1 [Glycine soja]KAH1069639.1 hypothetical protein GYH30_007005 [Glycine max]KAH1257904.1 putative serine/threonine protein kinase IREH1 [Glycine max]KRH66674.1 hypothetical protein GLYMA_03G121400v4 [Glycine max]RZC20308.1 putative serine/threonine protein kinase IREH1 [Glycine soja]
MVPHSPLLPPCYPITATPSTRRKLTSATTPASSSSSRQHQLSSPRSRQNSSTETHRGGILQGVRPFSIWKHRAFGHMEEVMAAIRVMFEKLKEEVDSDLDGFAGDLVGILEKNVVSDREWKERLEDLWVVTLQCVCVR